MGQEQLILVMFQTAAKQQLKTLTELCCIDYSMEFKFSQNLSFKLHIFNTFCLTNMPMMLHWAIKLLHSRLYKSPI